jgi:adenine-specific DNA-methyltransferase
LRYIGNKTRLLGFISDVLDAEHVRRGRALDAFAGTASVGRFLKRRGFSVASCDIMTYSHVLQRVYVELDRQPRFTALARKLGITSRNGARTQSVLDAVVSSVGPRRSFISREFAAPVSDKLRNGSRMYFTAENARRIDAVRESLDEWRADGVVSRAERDVILASLLEAMDSVANTTGVYAAYVKSWQSNALKPLALRAPELITGTGLACRAIQGDVNEVVVDIGGVDLLYLDPPYNSRQYSGYYHIPELVARGWSGGRPQLRGKTGLIPDADKRSAWSRRRTCVAALNDLLDKARARYVIMSYNSEGIIPEDEIRRAFTTRAARGTFRVYTRDYARYRSDSDGAERRYKGSRVMEKIYFARMKR